MPGTKPKKRTVPVGPVIRFTLAEDIRQEIQGKVSAIGLYSDYVVVLAMPATEPEPSLEEPLAIRSLGFLFNISNLSKATSVSVDLEVNGSRKPFVAAQVLPATEPGRSINLIAVMSPCLVNSFGEKFAVVRLDEEDVRFKFEFRLVRPYLTGKHLPRKGRNC